MKILFLYFLQRLKSTFYIINKILLYSFLLCIAAPAYWIYSLSWRIKLHGKEEIINKYIKNKGEVIFAYWHGEELILLPYYSFKNHFVLSSLSKDGSIMAFILQLYGYRVFRGSSSRRGGIGLLSMIKAMEGRGEKKSQCSLAVDGPRGPIHKVKQGIAQLSFHTDLPIIALRVYADRFWRIPNAWNKAFIPKAFSRVHIYVGEPIFPPKVHRKEKRKEIKHICHKVEKELFRLNSRT